MGDLMGAYQLAKTFYHVDFGHRLKSLPVRDVCVSRIDQKSSLSLFFRPSHGRSPRQIAL
jgi:hypothetical protein